MDKDSSYWNRFWEGPEIGLQWKHKVAAELVASEPVVDIGCGSGLLLELLRQRGFRSLLGCDISSSSIHSKPRRAAVAPTFRSYDISGGKKPAGA